MYLNPTPCFQLRNYLIYVMFHYAAEWDVLLKICVVPKRTDKESIAKSDGE